MGFFFSKKRLFGGEEEATKTIRGEPIRVYHYKETTSTSPATWHDEKPTTEPTSSWKEDQNKNQEDPNPKVEEESSPTRQRTPTFDLDLPQITTPGMNTGKTGTSTTSVC